MAKSFINCREVGTIDSAASFWAMRAVCCAMGASGDVLYKVSSDDDGVTYIALSDLSSYEMVSSREYSQVSKPPSLSEVSSGTTKYCPRQ